MDLPAGPRMPSFVQGLAWWHRPTAFMERCRARYGKRFTILLDEAPHLEQRKLLLPAFHGEKMQKLTGLMEELAEREVATWPTGRPFALHPRFQALTLEIILRAVFGMESGERLDTLHRQLTEILEFGNSLVSVNP